MAGKLIRNTSTPELRAWWEKLEALSATAPRLIRTPPDVDESRPEDGDRARIRPGDASKSEPGSSD